MKKILSFLKARLAETSTKTVIVSLLTAAVGSKVAPEHIDLIVTALIVVLGYVAAFVGEDKPGA